MELRDLYNSQNESLTDEILSEILDMDSDFEHNLQDRLVRNIGVKSSYPLYQDDLFEKVKFTSWINLVMDSTKDKKILKELKEGRNLQRREDIERFVMDTREKYPTISIYPFSNRTWNTMNSNSASLGTIYSPDEMKHALFLSLDDKKVYQFVNMLTISCLKLNIPFNYRFRIDYEADDKVIVYATDDSLEPITAVIKHIISENPELINKERQLPLLVSKIEPWLGYGSGLDKNSSFHNLRSKLLEESILETNKKWLEDSNYKEKDIRIKNDIVDAITKFLNKLAKGEINGSSISLPVSGKKIVEFIDYNTLLEWKNGKSVSKALDSLLIKIKNGEDLTNLKIFCSSKNKRQAMHFYEGFLHHLSKYTAGSKESIDYLRTVIKVKASKYGIDSNNFAFGTGSSKKITNEEKEEKYMKAII